MYESDGVDEMYMDYRRDHPFDKEDKKFILKVFAGVIVLYAWMFLSANNSLSFKDKSPTAKEIQNNKTNQVNSVDTIKFNAVQNTQKTR